MRSFERARVEPAAPFRSASPHCSPQQALPALSRVLTLQGQMPAQMIKTVEKNSIIADFQCGLGNKTIAKNHGHSRTTIIGFRKAYNEAMSSSDPDAALTEFIQRERVPSKRNRKHPKLTDAIRAIINADLDDNKVKMATGRRKMVKLGTDIYECKLPQKDDVAVSGVQPPYSFRETFISTASSNNKNGSRLQYETEF